MKLYDKLVDKTESLALVGLGYVGMPIAVAFARKGLNVIGFDLNKEQIELYKNETSELFKYRINHVVNENLIKLKKVWKKKILIV